MITMIKGVDGMLKAEFIQTLKRTNVSVDSTKTRERVKILWKKASHDAKNRITIESGVGRSTIYRVYNTGSISAKLIVSIALNLNITPFYLTGETDEVNECALEMLDRFLRDRGYSRQLDEFLAATLPKIADEDGFPTCRQIS